MSHKPFTFPPGVIMIRDSYPDGAVYAFEDETIGVLGRLIMTGVSQPRLTFRTELRVIQTTQQQRRNGTVSRHWSPTCEKLLKRGERMDLSECRG